MGTLSVNGTQPCGYNHQLDELANKRPRLYTGDENGTVQCDERESPQYPPHADVEASSTDKQQASAETGDIPLPTHSTDDLDDIRAMLATTTPPKSTANVPFHRGVFLAPMVRIGSLPTRLLSLRYGADLVWSPEIVDRAIIGCDRVVNAKTGVIEYLREGKQILTTHPTERDRMIFQLGSSSPEWAYKAIKFVTAHDEVAGVDLNCGCPKSFSTIGGMGAQLLGTPDLLCDILRAMRIAAPPHVSVTCKIRLLPTKEKTQALVRQILRTGCIDALTVHCRTKDMRPREMALLSRLAEVKEVVDEETQGRLPLICNGDAWDVREAKQIMQATGVSSVMIARGAEGNPSCFSPNGYASVADVIAPLWTKVALALDNHYGNTKYCIQSLAMKPSSSVVPSAPPVRSVRGWNKAKLSEVRTTLSRAKSNEEMAQVLGVDVEAAKSLPFDALVRSIDDTIAGTTQAFP